MYRPPKPKIISLLAGALPLAYWPGKILVATPGRWSLLAVGVPLCCKFSPLPRKLTFLLGGLLLYAWWSLSWAKDPQTGMFALVHWEILVFALLVSFKLKFENKITSDQIMLPLAWAMAINTGLALLQLRGWHPVLEGPNVSPAGLLYNKEILAETLAPVVVWALTNSQTWLGLFLGLGLAICQSRIALASFVVGILVSWVQITGFRSMSSKLIGLGFICVGLAIILAIGLDPSRAASALQRLEIWQISAGEIEFWGHGIGQYQVFHPNWEYPHSDGLQILWELGYIPAALCLLLLALALKTASRITLAPALSAFIFTTLVSFPFQMPTSAFMGMALVGMGLAGNRPAWRIELRRTPAHQYPGTQTEPGESEPNSDDSRSPTSSSSFPA